MAPSRIAALFGALAVVLAACQSDGTGPAPATSLTTLPAVTTSQSPPGTPPPPRTLPPPPVLAAGETICDGFAVPSATGSVSTAQLTEASGVVASRTQPGVLWVHNDSGDAAAVYAVGTDGSDLGRFRLTNAVALDWEDIAIGPGPEPGRDYLYLADIGDNLGFRGNLTVYRIPEPVADRAGGLVEDVEALRVTYGEGDRGLNAEAMFVDPLTGDVYIVTKGDDGTPSIVFRAPARELAADRIVLMEPVAILDLGDRAQVTAADIATDGGTVVLRGYNEVWMWARNDLDIGSSLSEEPCTAPSPDEVQGESIALAPGGGYYTISEGTRPAVNYVAPEAP